MEHLNGFPDELEFCARAIADDSKNYHAWSYRYVASHYFCRSYTVRHRQWLLRRFNVGWEQERAFLDNQLISDVRNNSAWNQRYFLITNSPVVQTDRPAYIRSEFEFACQKIRVAPSNESVWNFIRGCESLFFRVRLSTMANNDYV